MTNSSSNKFKDIFSKLTRAIDNNSLIILLFILLLGLGFRLVDINYWRLTSDEMSIGYNAYSVLLTSKDEWGKTFPIIFQAFGDYKLPIYIYSTIPFIKILGLTSVAIKLPSLLAGVLLIALTYFFAKFLLKDSKLALLSALIIALSPWSMHLSKMALESNLALVFFMIGLNLFIFQFQPRFKKSKYSKYSWLIGLISGFVFGLTIYTYVAYRLLVGLIFISLVFVFFLKREYKFVKWTIMGLSMSFIPWIYLAFFGVGSVRFSQLFSGQAEGVNAFITDKHNYCFIVNQKYLHPICRRIFTPTFQTLNLIAKNYFSSLTSSFLFLDGDSLKYLSVPGYGQFVVILLPFYLFGVVLFFLRKKDLIHRLTFLFFLFTPIAAALVGAPQGVRLSAMLPFVALFISFGLGSLLALVKNKTVRALLFLGVISFYFFTSLVFLLDFIFIYPKQYRAQFYPVGKNLVEAVNKLDSLYDYDKIYITNDFPDAHILFAFWNKLDPKWYRRNIKRPNPDKFGFQHPNKLGKLEFGPRLGSNDVLEATKSGDVLYITGATDDLDLLFKNKSNSTKLIKSFSGVDIEAKLINLPTMSARSDSQ